MQVTRVIVDTPIRGSNHQLGPRVNTTKGFQIKSLKTYMDQSIKQSLTMAQSVTARNLSRLSRSKSQSKSAIGLNHVKKSKASTTRGSIGLKSENLTVKRWHQS